MTCLYRLTVLLLSVLLISQLPNVSGQVCEQPFPDFCDTTVPVIRQNQPYGATCISSVECTATTICKSGVCGCADGNQLINNVCAVAPGFGSPCLQGVCKSPVLCDGTGFCNLCPVGFNSTGFGCIVACGINDIKTDNGCLPPVSAIGGQCQDSSQCQVAYSQCINSRCTCALGTQQIGNACQPTNIRCPSGEPYKFPNGTAQSCKTIMCNANANRPAIEVSGCPLNYNCARMSSQLETGVCCPLETPWCPIGEPLSGKVCNESLIGQPQPFSIINSILPINTATLNAADVRCPLKTHYCHKTGVTNQLTGGYCCPLPCPNLVDPTSPSTSTVSIVDGLCVKRTPLGGTCQWDGQCPENAQCDPVLRICVCRANFVQQVTNGDASGQQRCALRCSASQISVANGCFDAVLPMGLCTFSAQCTQGGTVCRGGKCQCKCGEYLQNSQCIPSPTCPPYIGSDPSIKIPPLSDQFGFHDCTPTTNIASVDICGRYGGYCAAIGINNFCCPLPAANCPGGQSPTFINGAPLPCSLQAAPGVTECSVGTYCYNYISAVIQLPSFNTIKGICCPSTTNNIIPGIVG